MYIGLDQSAKKAIATDVKRFKELTDDEREEWTKEYEHELENEMIAVNALKGHSDYFVLPWEASMELFGTVCKSLVMPLGETDGFNWIEKNPSNSERAGFIKDLLQAGIVLHNEQCIHNDLKLENMLFQGGRWKLSDFGSLEKLQSQQNGGKLGTPGYIAPELFEGGQGDTKISCFSMGIMLAEVCGLTALQEVLQGFEPTRDANGDLKMPDKDKYIAKIEQARGYLRSLGESPLADVIVGLLDPNPETRLSAEEATLKLQDIDLPEVIGQLRDSVLPSLPPLEDLSI